MSFLVEIGMAGDQDAVNRVAKVEGGLDKIDTAASKASTSMTKLAKAGADAGEAAAQGLGKTTAAAERAVGGIEDLNAAVAKLGATNAAATSAGVGGFSAREIAILEQIKGPLREHTADIEALNRLNSLGQVSTKQYEDQLIRLEHQYGASGRAESILAQQLEQEAKTLERLRGPMKAYEQEVATLERLMKQGSITADEYQAELDKQAKKAGVWQGPTAGGPASPSKEADLQGGLAGALGTAGSLLSGGAIAGGVMALGQGVEHLVQQYRDLQDVYIDATNSAMKFADSSHSVTVVIDEQIRLAHDLHSNYSKTIEVYDAVRDGTDELAISHADQIRLTQSLSEEVQIAGKSMEAAGGIATKFGYALASGSISSRELKSIMREIPDIADTWTKHFDTTRAGIMSMVKAGTIGTEDLMRALIDEGAAIDANFAKRERTNAQKREEWALNEKIYSQRYDVSAGQGHQAQQAVDALKQMASTAEGRERVSAIAEHGGAMAWASGVTGATPDLAKAALDQLQQETQAALGNMYDSVVNLTGPFQELGDKLRAAEGDTAAVRAEVAKLHDPIDAARHQMDVLNQAFNAGKIEFDEYAEAFDKARTVLQRGLPDPAFAMNKSISDARKSLELLKADMRAGTIDGGLEAYKKQELSLIAQANNGRLPENLRITAPIAQAKIELQELEAQMKSLGGNSYAVRKRYDELMTTINDGRLPEAIKFWEALHDPISQTTRDIAALNALYARGRIDAAAYQVELSKATEAHIKFLQSNNPALERKLPDLATDTAIYAKERDPLGLEKDSLDPVGALQEKHVKLIQAERDELSKIKTPLEQYQNQIKALGDLFEAQHISPARYEAQVDAARAAFLAAQPEALTFGERVEQAFLKAKEAARQAGVEVKSYQRVLEEQQVARIEATPGTRTPDDRIAVALLKDKQAAEEAGVAASSYHDVLLKVRAAELAAGDEGKTFLGGLEAGWIKLKQEADAFDATIANNLLADIDKLNQSIVTAANGGQVAWGQMVDSMIQDLERLVVKQLEVVAVNALINAVTGGEAGAIGAVTGAVTSPNQVPGTGSLASQFPHGATGGTWQIGGTGGTDSRIAQAAISPGEYLRIQTPDQYRADTQRNQTSTQQQRAPEVHIHNHMDTSAVTAALTSREGQRVVANVIRNLNTGMRR